MSLNYDYSIEYITRYNRMTSAKIEDFDADGSPDIVVGDATKLAVDIWEHNPATQGFDRIARAEGFGAEIHDATLADVDGDGDKDMIAGLRGGGVQVALNKGDDTFAAPYTVDPRYTWRVIAEDMTGDGKVDIVQAPDFDFIKVLVGNGQGWFTELSSPTQVISGSNAKNVTAIDVVATVTSTS